MRVFKFRFWDKTLKSMYYRNPWTYDFTHKNIIPLQYTGLKDKNGKEIYEGDIVTDKDKNTTIVVWISEWAMFGCMFHDEWELYKMRGVKEIDESMFWTFPIENTQYKVIGNIHENSDLFSERISNDKLK